MSNPNVVSSDPVAIVANLPGPALLDRLNDELRAVEPAETGLFAGAIASIDPTSHGLNVDGVGDYSPGHDRPSQLNMQATLSSGLPKANKVRGDVDIPRLHIVADMPERLSYTTGDMSLQTLGRYAVALGLVLGEKARANASVVLSRSGAEQVFDDRASEGFEAMVQIDRNLENTEEPASSESSSLARALDLTERNIHPDSDITLVISDFMDGYNPETGEIDWQHPLHRLQSTLQDRLLAIRLKSPAQEELPIGAVRHLSLNQLARMRQEYRNSARIKSTAIANVLRAVRYAEIDGVKKPGQNPLQEVMQFLAEPAE